MSPRNRITRVVTSICGALLLLNAVARADDSSDSSADADTNSPPVFKAELFKGEFVGVDQILRLMLTSGTNQFMIVVPRGLQVDQSSPGKIVILSPDHSYYLIFRMIAAPESNPTKHDSFRGLLTHEYAGAKILEETFSQVAGHTGPSFDLFWRAYGGTEQFVRTAFIPSPAGILEFTLISNSENLRDAQLSFKGLLRGFRSNEKGKINIEPMIDYS